MISEILSARRKSLGLSIDELVTLSGVPKGTLTKVLTGVTPDPALRTVSAIATALGLTLDELTSGALSSFSPEAMRIALTYDSLNDVGKDMLNQAAAFASIHFQK